MKILKKILLYISSFFLIGFGFLLTYAVVFEENTYSSNDEILSGIMLTSAFSLISLLFFLPGVHLSGFIKNNKFISRLNIFTILSLFHLATLCGFLIKFMKYNYEVDRNLAIYCFIVSLICFYLRKKSKISSKDIASKISSLTDFKYKEFDDNELSKLLGNNTKIISKKNVCFPFNFNINLESKSDVEAQKMGFDMRSWNSAIERENKKIDENKEAKRHYENLYSNYQTQLQTYQLARQTKKQTVLGARHNKGGAGFEMFWTAGDKRPTPPKKPNYHVIENPKEEDFYTEDKGIELIKNLELKHDAKLNYFNFFDKDTFSKIFDISEWHVITKLLRDIYISSESKGLGQINSNFKPQDQDIKIKFNNSFLHSNSFEEKVDNNDLLKETIIDFENNHKKEKVEKILKDKDFKLGNFAINSNKINYKIKDLNYLPFLRVEIEGKNGDQKIEIIDYISRTVVFLDKK